LPIYLALALGGAFGAIARYWMSTGLNQLSQLLFPIGTFSVNVLGSFFIGSLYIYLSERPDLSDASRHLLITGFLGALTTFSSFSLETLLLIEQGHYNIALLNVIGSVMFCLGAAYLGISLARIFL
jgi:CrcB protein